ncbi:unnamed protein product [Protopolystoma xenopodis]|uniref:Uncharacterized protein n=1 Tax=Protopolystoma xenopodis TaxID=117903 RepID=A0A448WF34_9PLAT|nr:unnamed protein product [Protopolystoma xenopodis]
MAKLADDADYESGEKFENVPIHCLMLGIMITPMADDFGQGWSALLKRRPLDCLLCMPSEEATFRRVMGFTSLQLPTVLSFPVLSSLPITKLWHISRLTDLRVAVSTVGRCSTA